MSKNKLQLFTALKGLWKMLFNEKEIEEQRLAALNMLAKANNSEKKLITINKSLKKKQMEMETLANLGVEIIGTIDIEEAIRIFSAYLSDVIDFDVAVYALINIEEDGGLAYAAYLNREISESYLNAACHDFITYLSEQKDVNNQSSANIIKNIKPRILGKKLDNGARLELKQKIIYPLTLGSGVLGVIQLATSAETDIIKGKKEFIEAMLNNFSLYISRLQLIARSQNSRTGSLIESLSDGVIMFNLEKNIVLINTRALTYTGISMGKGPSMEDVYVLFSKHDIKAMVKNSLLEGERFHLEEIYINKYYFELFVIPVKDVYGKIVGGAIIMHDVTSIKKIDDMKTEFVSVASHQLRTPLTAIKLFTEMLIREEVGKINPEQADYLRNVHESTERMVRLVNDLLNVTRIESGRLRINPELMDVGGFIEGIIAEAKPLAREKGVKIYFTYDSALPKVLLDQNLMRQVIQNMLVNAIRYARAENGYVSLDIKKPDNDFFTIIVKDNGIGIPKEVHDRIFEKFFRANNAIKSVAEGTGLGLYVSRMIVESSGGKIWFESKKNEGTVFFMKLPLKGMKEQKGERGLAIS